MRTLQVLIGLDALAGGPPAVAIHANIAKQRGGVETTVAYAEAGSTGHARTPLHAAGVPLLAFPTTPRSSYAAKRWGVSPRLAGWLLWRVRDYDLVHIDAAWGLPSVVALVAAKLARRPVVLTPHESLTDFDLETSPNRPTRLIKAGLRRMYLRYADVLVFSSELEQDESVPPDGARARSVVIPHPIVDERTIAPPLAPRHGSSRRIGFLGRLDPKKNLNVLIESLALLPGDVDLVVGGDGPAEFKEELHAVARRAGVADRIEWRGFLSPEQRDRFFEDIDALAMPSEFECFGMVAAEALVAGRPVIVSVRAGLAEIIGPEGGGLVCEPSAADVADKVGTVLDEARYDTFAAQAQRTALGQLSYERYGSRIRSAFELALRRGR